MPRVVFLPGRRPQTAGERLRTLAVGGAAVPVLAGAARVTVRAVGQAIRDAPQPIRAGVVAPPVAGPVLSTSDSAGAAVPVRRLADYRGQVVVAAFYSTGCSGCKVALPELDDLAKEYRGRGLKVLAVNLDARGTQAQARAYLADLGVGLETVWDSTGIARRAYGVWAVPAFFVVDRAGVIRARSFGLREDRRVEWVAPSGRAVLDSLLAAGPAAQAGPRPGAA